MSDEQLPLALSVGCPSGIGPEVAVAACAKCQTSDAFAAMTLAGGAGFVVAFLATMPLPQAGLSSVRSLAAIDLAPFAMPLPTGGFEVGVGGSM